MTWTLQEIEREWLMDGEPLMFPADDVISAFELAESIRGPEWVRSCTYQPNGVRLLGFQALLPVITFAQRPESARGAINIEDLHSRLRKLDVAADSELTAIHVLRSGNMDAALEIGPDVHVGDHIRRPDFRIAKPGEPWTHVEVTRLHASH